MRDFLQSIAPANHAQKITKPLFVVQGRNDPRVPYTESDQMVATVKRNGGPVWYLLANDEGHGFAKKKNQDFQLYATVAFVRPTAELGGVAQRRRGSRVTKDSTRARDLSSSSTKRTATPRGWSSDSWSASETLTISARSATSTRAGIRSTSGRVSRRPRPERAS